MGHLKQLCEPLMAHERTGGRPLVCGGSNKNTSVEESELQNGQISYSFIEKCKHKEIDSVDS